MSGITCGNCKAKHDTVALIRACYGQATGTTLVAEQPRVVVDYPISVPAPEAKMYPASDKQRAFITRLAQERHYADPGMTRENQPSLGVIEDVLAGLPVSKKQASNTITYLQGCAKRDVVATVTASGAVTEVGMYRKGEDLYRVYPARSGGHLLCKMLAGSPETGWSFTYVGTPRSAGLKASDRMTLDEAKAFGQQFGVCCVCGALLTDPTSVAAGIGPVCGGRV